MEKSEHKNREYATIGPVPIHFLGLSVKQIEEQGWTVRFVAFGGMGEAKIVSPTTPQAFPVYAILSYRDFAVGEKVVAPSIRVGGPDAKNPL